LVFGFSKKIPHPLLYVPRLLLTLEIVLAVSQHQISEIHFL